MNGASKPTRFLYRHDVRLFLTSSTLLFVELILIRWIPANVTYVGFFSNFLLMASFLGIGLGILAGRRWGGLGLVPFSMLLATIVALVLSVQLNVQLRSSTELPFGIGVSNAADVNALVVPLMFGLVTLAMAALALPLGPLLRSMPPLRAYGIDIAGSMAGVAAFTILSAAGTDPLVWFGIVSVLVTMMSLGQHPGVRALLVPGAMAFAIVLVGSAFQQGDAWSPYYRISKYLDTSCNLINVNVDGIPHQALRPVKDLNQACAKEPFYEQVYRWLSDRTFSRVLIIGAGTGSDVALALANGATQVDAVEIDPRIHELASLHPDRPFDDPRVTSYIDDGRAFLSRSTESYDLIVFAQTDSLALLSSTAGLRLESFLFTEEAFESARDHLSADGVFALYNYYREPWLLQKLGGMLRETFGHEPLFRAYSNIYAALAAGPGVSQLPAGAIDPQSISAIPVTDGAPPAPATDDWPFVYLRAPQVADYYLLAIGAVLVAALLAVRLVSAAVGLRIRRFSPHFFVLGAAFLLLETRSLVVFSLLFGSTWLVNALVFFAILASVLLAVIINAKRPIRRPKLLYAGLFATLVIALVLPPDALFIEPPWLRYVVVSAITFAPVFFANLVFAYSFKDTLTADTAFAANLLGAVLGGCLEYVALLTGFRSLLLVVILLYALAALFARLRLFGDRDLAVA